MKKSICLFLVVFLLTSQLILSVLAIDDKTNTMSLHIRETIASFAEDVLGTDQYDAIVEMYGFDEQVNYLYFDFGEEGYIVYDIRNLLIAEASAVKNNVYNNLISSKIYYNGPLSYYTKKNDQFVDLYTNKSIMVSEAVPVQINHDRINNGSLNLGGNASVRAQTDYQVTINGNLPNYSYNPNGICGSTAAAMWFSYMDIYVDDNYVSDQLVTTDGMALIQDLVPYIDGVIPGSNTDDLRNGMQEYIDARNITKTMNSCTWDNTIFKARIAASRPVIIDLDSDPTYYEHWVVAYGYYVRKDPSISYLLVNDGHGNTGIHINLSYVGDMVY